VATSIKTGGHGGGEILYCLGSSKVRPRETEGA